MSLVLIIIIGILCFVNFGLGLYFLFADDDYAGFWGEIAISMFLSFVFAIFMKVYDKPHHGCSPEFEDVIKNEAYIDTTTIINHNDTTYEYQIKWKDE